MRKATGATWPMIRDSSAQAVAAFLGFFSSLNLVGSRYYPDFDANRWWIDSHRLDCRERDCAVVLIVCTEQFRFEGAREVRIYIPPCKIGL